MIHFDSVLLETLRAYSANEEPRNKTENRPMSEPKLKLTLVEDGKKSAVLKFSDATLLCVTSEALDDEDCDEFTALEREHLRQLAARYNAHDALVRACRLAREAKSFRQRYEAIEAIDAALALAEKGTSNE